MTTPIWELIICLINFLSGIFIMIAYTGVMLIEKKLNKYIISIIDIIATFSIGFIYLFILINNEIYFHIYYLIFLTSGYLIGYHFFYDKLLISYNKTFTIINYLYNKFKIIVHWSFNIIPFKLLKLGITKLVVKIKISIKKNKEKKKMADT